MSEARWLSLLTHRRRLGEIAQWAMTHPTRRMMPLAELEAIACGTADRADRAAHGESWTRTLIAAAQACNIGRLQQDRKGRTGLVFTQPARWEQGWEAASDRAALAEGLDEPGDDQDDEGVAVDVG